jgi:hypothetical protein
MCGPAGTRWRYRGRTPSPEVVAADLWRAVHCQYLVCDPAGTRLGVVGLYNASLDAGRVHGFAVGDPDRGAAVTEGFGLLCAHAFDELGFTRIFVEAPEFNLVQFASLGDTGVVEGRLRNYEMWQGRFWDLFIVSIGVEAFTARFGPLLAQRRDSSGGDHLDRDLAELAAELWPLDSLGAVEVLCALEEQVGFGVSDTVLSSVGAHDDPRRFAAALISAAADHIVGSADRPSLLPSGPATSTDPADTTSSASPFRQGTT